MSIIKASETNIIKASEGKVFKRISDGFIYGKEINLGYAYFIGGVKLDQPLLELPEHFEEIDDPNIEKDGEEVGE